jgi:hypothetical protein
MLSRMAHITSLPVGSTFITEAVVLDRLREQVFVRYAGSEFAPRSI